MNSERMLFVIECAAMHFGDNSVARAALRMLSYELRNEIKREQAYVRPEDVRTDDKISDGEVTQISEGATEP